MLNLYSLYVSEVEKYQLQNADEYFFRWLKCLEPGASSIKGEQPWMVFRAIDFLDANLKSTDKVFEYGGGGSTLFLVKRVAEVVTVEHNEEWFNVLSEIIFRKNIQCWKGHFVLPVKGDLVNPPDFANPEHYSSDDVPSYGFNYKGYVSVIDAFPDDYFECVIVDGRSRPACLKHSVSKIKKGGFLVLDNSDREYYLSQTQILLSDKFEKIFGAFGPSPYLQLFTHTTIWRKIT
jgi:hypothetical protein